MEERQSQQALDPLRCRPRPTGMTVRISRISRPPGSPCRAGPGALLMREVQADPDDRSPRSGTRLWPRHLDRGGADMSERRSPEVQFQLANERTYLAWLRTAGSHAPPLSASQPQAPGGADRLPWAWETVGVLLILAGVVTAALARRACGRMDAAMREGENPAGSGHRRNDRGGHRALRAHHHGASARNEPRTGSMIDWGPLHPNLRPGDRLLQTHQHRLRPIILSISNSAKARLPRVALNA